MLDVKEFELEVNETVEYISSLTKEERLEYNTKITEQVKETLARIDELREALRNLRDVQSI